MSSSGSFQRDPKALSPKPEHVAVLEGLRHSDVKLVATRLGRVGEHQRDRTFIGAGNLFLGGFAGGAFGLIPFLTASPRPSETEQALYFLALGASLVIAIACLLGARAVKEQRAESVGAIAEDLNKMLAAYDDELAGLAKEAESAGVHVQVADRDLAMRLTDARKRQERDAVLGRIQRGQRLRFERPPDDHPPG